MIDTRSHQMHRKATINKYVLRHRKIWRIYWRIDKLFLIISVGKFKDYERTPGEAAVIDNEAGKVC